MHESGRQRAFGLGNPFYARFKEDGEYWRKEMPNGDKYLVEVEVIIDEFDMPVGVTDVVIKNFIPS